MHFTLTEEQLAVQQRARDALRFVHQQRAAFRERILRRGEFPESIWAALAEAGFMGAIVPKEYGGRDEGLLAMALAMEALGGTGYGFPLPAVTTMAIAAIAACGNEGMKAALLPRLARGECKICIGVTEEAAGVNTFRIQTHARREGDGYLINGQKMYTSGADVADYILLLTRTMTEEQLKSAELPKTMGLSVFLVAAAAPGITRRKIHAHGEAGMNTFVTEYRDVLVSENDRVGDEHMGAMALVQMMNPERILFAASGLGIVDYCLDRSREFARERRVFRDAPIAQYQAVQHPLADLAMRNEAARLVTYRAAAACDAGLDPLAVGFHANSAKYLAGELAVKAVDVAIEIFGGRGFDEDYDIIHLWPLARLLKGTPISPNMVLNFVAEHHLGLPRSY